MEEADIVTSPEREMAPSIEALGSSTAHEFLRYFVASAVALVVDAGSLALMISVFGVPYLISGAIAFCLGVATIYLLSIRWVFEKRAFKSAQAEFALFLIIGIVGLGINELILWVLTGQFGFFYLFSKGASVFVVFLWNFFARKTLLFRHA
ncbi:MAG: GtrA family protein [Patescibacteria group bacterium]|nr:GtrA family protein [Patescibacteria group bacterium]